MASRSSLATILSAERSAGFIDRDTLKFYIYARNHGDHAIANQLIPAQA
jgi:hypothetical protein